MMHNTKVLHNLLQVLVDEWGFDRVSAGLKHFAHDAPQDVARPSRRIDAREQAGRPRRQAVVQVLRARLPPDQQAPLLALAKRFDESTFLPSVADAREFLAMMGEEVGTLKDRSAAFALVLRRLSELPPARIEAIAASPRFSGPPRLGPISEAIAATAAALARRP